MTERLAVAGGQPVRTEPMPGWPRPSEDEIAAAVRVLRSGRLNYWTGDEGRAFEAEYAERLGRAHGIALANGTVALELALRAFGIAAGDEVVVPARTFIATASACVAMGATPVIADIDPDSGCLTATTVSAVLSPRTRAVIPVHLAGWPVDMGPLMKLAVEHDLKVIEDCAQAHGARVGGREVGSWGHAAAFSFCQDKIITTGGEGGLLVLDDDTAYEFAWSYKDHGKSRRRSLDSTPSWGCTFKWLHDSFGTNWRMTEMQAAMGRVALGRLDEWVTRRRNNALRLADALHDCPGVRLPLPVDATHAFYRLMGRIDSQALAPGWTRDLVLEAIRAEGVPVVYGPCAEIYRENAFERAGLTPAGRAPIAASVDAESCGFLVHPTLSDDDIDDVARAARKVLSFAAVHPWAAD